MMNKSRRKELRFLLKKKEGQCKDGATQLAGKEEKATLIAHAGKGCLTHSEDILSVITSGIPAPQMGA